MNVSSFQWFFISTLPERNCGSLTSDKQHIAKRSSGSCFLIIYHFTSSRASCAPWACASCTACRWRSRYFQRYWIEPIDGRCKSRLTSSRRASDWIPWGCLGVSDGCAMFPAHRCTNWVRDSRPAPPTSRRSWQLWRWLTNHRQRQLCRYLHGEIKITWEWIDRD